MASKSTRKLAEEDVEMDMTPMIDVTFLLLIFFMCTLSFATSEGMLISYLPKDQGVFKPPAKQDPVEPSYIKLIKVGKETKIGLGSDRYAGEAKFEKLFQKLSLIVKSTPNSPVIIDPDIEVPFQDVISTLNVCRRIQNEAYGKKLKVKFAANHEVDEKKK